MTAIRITFVFFVFVVIAIAIAGWFWTTQHQAPSQACASHLVLAASALAGCVGLGVVWKRPHDLEQNRD